MLSQPRVLRPPSYSFLELRWPIIASVAITLLVIVVIVWCLTPRPIRTLVIVATLAGINLAGAFACQGLKQPRLLSSTWGYAGAGEEYYSDGSRRFTESGPGIPWHVTRIELPNSPPTFLRTWWPILTSTGITLLLLGILGRQARQRSISAADTIDSS